MTILMKVTIFFACYEVMKVIMPQVESSWRMYVWELRQKKETHKVTIGGEDSQINISFLGENEKAPEAPAGYMIYTIINLAYIVYLACMFLSFNPICMLSAIIIHFWGRIIVKAKPLKRYVMLDGAISAAILFATYITQVM